MNNINTDLRSYDEATQQRFSNIAPFIDNEEIYNRILTLTSLCPKLILAGSVSLFSLNLLSIDFKQRKPDLDFSLSEPLTEEELEEEKKQPALGKPHRGGSKKFYVYVKDPKTKRIKKVSFGMAGGGLHAKLNNPKARQAFAKRHNCPQKKDRTKASYWSCRLPKFAKLLGFKTTFTGYW